MDLNQLVTQENSDYGVWTPVVLYGKQQDFDLLILGDDADAVQKHERESLKKMKKAMGKAMKGNDIEFDDETLDEVADNVTEKVLVRIAGIRGWKIERKGSKEINREPESVTLCGEAIVNDTASYKKLIDKIPALKEFVLKVSRDRTNFLSKPSGN